MLGNRECLNCKQNNFSIRGKELKVTNKVEAQKSYIPLDKQQYQEVRVRDLSIQELAIGRIILHGLIMMIMVFSDSHTIIEVMKILGLYEKQNEYQLNFQNTVKFLGKRMSYDWSTLQTLWCVNEEKVLQVVQSVIINMVKQAPKFHIEYLKSPGQRSTLEACFKQVISAVLSNRDKFFKENVEPTT